MRVNDERTAALASVKYSYILDVLGVKAIFLNRFLFFLYAQAEQKRQVDWIIRKNCSHCDHALNRLNGKSTRDMATEKNVHARTDPTETLLMMASKDDIHVVTINKKLDIS